MVRRSARLLFELLGALLAGAAIAVGLVAWRLSSGPIALEFLTPYLEEALSEPDGPTVGIERTVVTWRGWDANPELRAEGVTAKGPDGSIIATVPAVAVSISLESALRGVVAPARVELVEPRLHLVREADGGIRIDIGQAAAEGGGSSVVERMARELSAPPHRDSPLGQLRRLGIRDAIVTIDDRKLGRTWTLPDGDFVFRRGDRGLDGTLSLAVDLGGRALRIDGEFVHRRDAGGTETPQTEVLVHLDLPDPTRLAQLAPELAPLADLQVPLKADAKLTLGPLERVRAAELRVDAGAGRIVHAALPEGQIEVAAAVGRARWAPDIGRLTLEDLFVDLGGPSLTVTGTVDGIAHDGIDGGPMRVAMDAALVDVSTATLGRIWPRAVVPNGRRWVIANITDGGIRDAQLKLDMTLPTPGAEPRVDRLEGVFSYAGLTVNYMNGLPPVRQVAGTARFDDQQMVLETAGGVLLRQTRVGRGTIRLTDFQKKDQQIIIDVQTSGPAREALEVIDRPRLGFLARFGLKPAEVAGDSQVQLSFAFPAIDALRIDDVRLRASAAIKGGALPAGVRDWRLTDADLALDVDKDRLELRGNGRLHGVPVALTGREVFSAAVAVRSEYTLKGRIDDDARRRLGIDVAPWVTGPADVDLAFVQRAEKRSTLTVRADLAAAAMAVAPAGWRKAPGAAASGELTVDFVGDRPIAARTLRVAAPGLAVEGSVDLARDSWTLDVARLALGETQLAGRVRPRGAGYEATLRGPTLDLRPFLERGESGSATEGQAFRLDARFDRVILGQGRMLQSVAADIDLDGKGGRRVAVDGVVNGGGAVTLRLAPGPDGVERLDIRAADFGGLVAGFDGPDNIRGGTLVVNGSFHGPPGHQVVHGTALATGYRMVRAPILTRLLGILSLTSFVSLLQGDGLPFTEARLDFTWSDGRLAIRQGRAYGGAIGGTFEGTVDLRAAVVDLEGTLVPAYTLNNLLGNIPILGTILAGGRDEGVFAANYRVAGPIADPQVSVNPLSALAPGILRKILPFLDAGDPRTQTSGGAPAFRQDGVKPTQ
ncbi:MAG: AsmA-like C-terminal domain-containing protein [Alphaproteobacteria bacterium]